MFWFSAEGKMQFFFNDIWKFGFAFFFSEYLGQGFTLMSQPATCDANLIFFFFFFLGAALVCTLLTYHTIPYQLYL